MARRTKEEKVADLEAEPGDQALYQAIERGQIELAAHKRKLRMETVPGVKEAVFIARAMRKWQADFSIVTNELTTAIAYLEAQAEETP